MTWYGYGEYGSVSETLWVDGGTHYWSIAMTR